MGEMAVNMDVVFENIKEIDERNARVVTAKQIEEAGICRGLIKKFVEDGKLVKEKGIISIGG